MLKLEVHFADVRPEPIVSFDVAPEYDATLSVTVKLCDWCKGPFIPKKQNHRFCYDRNCKSNFHRKSVTA